MIFLTSSPFFSVPQILPMTTYISFESGAKFRIQEVSVEKINLECDELDTSEIEEGDLKQDPIPKFFPQSNTKWWPIDGNTGQGRFIIQNLAAGHVDADDGKIWISFFLAPLACEYLSPENTVKIEFGEKNWFYCDQCTAAMLGQGMEDWEYSTKRGGEGNSVVGWLSFCRPVDATVSDYEGWRNEKKRIYSEVRPMVLHDVFSNMRNAIVFVEYSQLFKKEYGKEKAERERISSFSPCQPTTKNKKTRRREKKKQKRHRQQRNVEKKQNIGTEGSENTLERREEENDSENDENETAATEDVEKSEQSDKDIENEEHKRETNDKMEEKEKNNGGHSIDSDSLDLEEEKKKEEEEEKNYFPIKTETWEIVECGPVVRCDFTDLGAEHRTLVFHDFDKVDATTKERRREISEMCWKKTEENFDKLTLSQILVEFLNRLKRDFIKPVGNGSSDNEKSESKLQTTVFPSPEKTVSDGADKQEKTLNESQGKENKKEREDDILKKKARESAQKVKNLIEKQDTDAKSNNNNNNSSNNNNNNNKKGPDVKELLEKWMEKIDNVDDPETDDIPTDDCHTRTPSYRPGSQMRIPLFRSLLGPNFYDKYVTQQQIFTAEECKKKAMDIISEASKEITTLCRKKGWDKKFQSGEEELDIKGSDLTKSQLRILERWNVINQFLSSISTGDSLKKDQ